MYIYSFVKHQYEKYVYPSIRLGDYEAIKEFLEPHAPPRQLTSYELLALPSNKTLYASE